MATRTPVECPLCRETVARGRNLEEHLVASHNKRRLARFVVAETEALHEEDISE